jgi:23S rRNA (guanosine2251-2'-O)-methyltransferase
MSREIILIAHDIRSCHNVGSLLRTADGVGVKKVYLTGYTPYPLDNLDNRLPHISKKINSQIQKTALGAEKIVDWVAETDVLSVLNQLSGKYSIVALEQNQLSVPLPSFHAPEKIAIILGSEVSGISDVILDQCEQIVEIPMQGTKESFNVVQAAAMMLYHIAYVSP